MIEGLHKLFSRKNKVRRYGYGEEYGEAEEMEDEDIFPDEKDRYMEDEYSNGYDVEDEYFD